MEINNLDEFLKSIKNVLDTIGKDYVEVFSNLLIKENEYDKLFFGYAKRYNLNERNLKEKSLLRISNSSEVFDLEKLKENIKNYFKEDIMEENIIIKKKEDISYDDLYSIIDRNLPKMFKDIDELKKVIYSDECIIPELKLFYEMTKKEEKSYVLSYLSLVVYGFLNVYKEDDFINYDIEFIENLLKTDIDSFLAIYINYLNMPKENKDYMFCSLIENNETYNLLKICPFSMFEFRKFYNLKYENEEIDSIRLGKKTLEYINDCIRESYNGLYKESEIYKNAFIFIKSRYQVENTTKWIKSLCSNVYQHLNQKKGNLAIDEILFIESINNYNNDFSDFNLNIEFIEFVLLKFYELNSDLYDEMEVYNLNISMKKDTLNVVKNLNPYYEQEKRYLKKRL